MPVELDLFPRIGGVTVAPSEGTKAALVRVAFAVGIPKDSETKVDVWVD